MDVRDLFAMIGRLYAANVELTEEGDKLKSQVLDERTSYECMKKEAEGLRNSVKSRDQIINDYEKRVKDLEIECKDLKQGNNDLIGIVAELQEKLREAEKENDGLRLRFSRPAGCDGMVDARREEETLKEDEF